MANIESWPKNPVQEWIEKQGDYDWNENILKSSFLKENTLQSSFVSIPETMKAKNICFACKGGSLCIDLETWEVTYPEGVTIPEATKILFDGLKQFA